MPNSLTEIRGTLGRPKRLLREERFILYPPDFAGILIISETETTAFSGKEGLLYHGKNRQLHRQSPKTVSRRDLAKDTPVTTFDIRMTRPNKEPVMNTAEVHTIEHLGATFLRNHRVFGSSVLYFGPMGCRTGFYLILTGDYESADIVPLLQELFLFIRDYEGDVPGASPVECGNCLDMNLPMAKYLAGKFYDEVLEDIHEEQLVYPA